MSKIEKTIEIKWSDITDSSTRLLLLESIVNYFNLSLDEAVLLMFLSMGDVDNTPQRAEILKKIKIPKVKKSKYNYERLNKWIEYLKRQLLSINRDYGVVDLEKNKLIRPSKNGKYITVYGIKVSEFLYKGMIKTLENNPNYVIDVMLGIYEALGKIINFLEAVEVEV